MTARAVLTALALLSAAPAAQAQAIMDPSLERDVHHLETRSGGKTFVVALGNAPFPVGPDAVDHRGEPFWHGIDGADGRYRVVVEGTRYTERAVYADSRVLFHAVKGFDPAKPFRLVLFLHGHGSEIERTVAGELDLPGQLNRAGVNAVLIAPQLARDATESAPGKFVEPGRAAAFLDEAQGVLHWMLGGALADWRRAPLVVAAFSGGYRTAGQVIERGGLDERIQGAIMLDAFFADTGVYAGWLARHHQRAFLYALYSRSSADETEKLKEQLLRNEIAYRTGDDGGPLVGVRLVPVDTPHAAIPRLGPPVDPVGALLRRIGS